MLRRIAYISVLGFVLVAAGFHEKDISALPKDYSVARLLETLGEPPSRNKPDLSLAGVSAQRGQDIVEKGSSREGYKRSKRQSKYFNCLACHNQEREDPDLTNPDPTARLEYVKEHGLPFVQGSPFFGIVNRTHFYNGDYEKKYGELVKPTRENIREAIQLCAVECSQGRPLEDFEIESVLAYFWTLEYKVSDLGLSTDEFTQVEKAFDTGKNTEPAAEIIKSKYITHSPATFLDPPKDRNSGDGLVGNPENGKLIYELSCQYCHFENDYSFLTLDNETLTFKHLAADAPTYKPHSLYQVIRYGTYPKRGKRAYMPLYTKEKMSDQQMADLRSYVDLKANKNL